MLETGERCRRPSEAPIGSRTKLQTLLAAEPAWSRDGMGADPTKFLPPCADAAWQWEDASAEPEPRRREEDIAGRSPLSRRLDDRAASRRNRGASLTRPVYP